MSPTMNKDNPCMTQSLTDVLSDIALYLEAAERFSLDPGQGVQLADCIISYCADYAKTMAGRAAPEGVDHE
ncbi:Uncharacterised protein [Yersinia pseudotuberculosis]|nr:Uncharacterised protein [Yersinia pseudotuberculosis]